MVVLYALTLFVSALLLFLVQPMVGKMTLPMLGGTPAVWNTCMVFFQALLLAGYAYAHASTRLLGARRQTVLHLIVLALPLALMTLPIAVPAGVSPPTEGNPTGWLLMKLLAWVGLPFFVISTSAPLLQTWFSNTGHRSAKDPYFLYAASNAGSLLALFAYPLLLEPAFEVTAQSRLWMFGYFGLGVLVVACAAALWFSGRATDSTAPALDDQAVAHAAAPAAHLPVTAGRRLWWVVLSMIPSSLMLGATTHITTNVAPVPLLWVVPLALYLITFIMVFGTRRLIPHRLWVAALPFLVLGAGLLSVSDLLLGPLSVPVHLVGFFACAVVCHGELANGRPATSHLTEYFLLMSLGGVLGGLFNAIVAPLVFTSIAEYPIMIALAVLVAARAQFAGRTPLQRTADQGTPHAPDEEPQGGLPGLDIALDLALPLVVAALAAALAWWYLSGQQFSPILFFKIAWLPAVLLAGIALFGRPLRFGLGLAGLMLVLSYAVSHGEGKVLHCSRNFYGAKTILETGTEDAGAHVFMHGITNHGFQQRNPVLAREPMAYFHRQGPVGDVLPLFCETGRREPNIAIVGLAAGSMAAYGMPGQRFTFYEIDPDVAKIAENPQYFTFLSDCRAEYDIVIGDGRLTLDRAPDAHYGLIVLDAFSSDAVPTHLLTREAVQLYLRKLTPDGAIMFNVSNVYLNLAGLLGNVASAEGLVAFCRDDLQLTEEQKQVGRLGSQYVIMARSPAHLRGLASNEKWRQLEVDPQTPTWTDQFSNIISLFRSQVKFTGRPR